jgi:CRP/FNR family transcriptional regulator
MIGQAAGAECVAVLGFPCPGAEPCASAGKISLGLGVQKCFARNGVLYEEGKEAAHVFRVDAGAVRLVRLLADGRRQIVGFCFAGDVLALGDGEFYGCCAEAIGEVTVTRYGRQALSMRCARDPQMQGSVQQWMHDALRASQRQIVMLGRLTVRERLAAFLEEMAQRLMVEGRGQTILELPMSRLDIADYLGLTIETVSRAFGDLKRMDVIAVLTAHRIVLCDRQRLKDMAMVSLPRAPRARTFPVLRQAV